MSEETKIPDANKLAAVRTDLAYERTALANDRTLMAWIRTSVSLISFGFTIYKFFQEMIKSGSLDTHKTLLSPREVGMILIALGFLGLFFALIQYKSDMKRLSVNFKSVPRSFTPLLAILILIFGLLLFLAALLRQ